MSVGYRITIRFNQIPVETSLWRSSMTTDVFSLCAATLMGFPLQGSGAATPDEIKVLARSPGALSRVVVSDDRLLTCRLGGALEEPKKYARVLLRVISNN